MFWYVKYKFKYAEQPHLAIERLKSTVSKDKWGKLVSKFTPDEVKIHHKGHNNSWNPIFVGKFKPLSSGSELIGYFRVNWAVIIFMIFFISYSAFRVIDTLSQPEIMPGFEENWKSVRLNFDLKFLGFAIFINLIGWLFGLPNQKKIVRAINESSCDV